MIDFVEPTTSKLKVKVTVDKSTKIVTIGDFDAKGNLKDAIAVIDAVLAELGKPPYDVKSIKKISVWNVYTEKWVEIIYLASDIAPIFGDYQKGGNIFTASDIAPIFGDYQKGGNFFTAADIAPIFDGTHKLSY